MRPQVTECWWLIHIHSGVGGAIEVRQHYITVKRKYCQPGRIRLWEILGVMVDHHLKFSQHVDMVVGKANRMLGMIRHTLTIKDRDNILLLYKSLVLSHMEYANAVWPVSCKKDTSMQKIEGVQMRATWMIPGFGDLYYRTRLELLRLPRMAYRRARNEMLEVYKCSQINTE